VADWQERKKEKKCKNKKKTATMGSHNKWVNKK